ncbi:hypothetical protein LOY38_17790 [Pseudomonas sp. B21-015]|uniref:hypothetical protein n=1 Tax=Pseudomonas sp. B21-015 TaxID=2895473 RepID=UPI00215E9E84|nr:hypothetical protein [Pseudomonas sp. B21-015]UVM48253.1 hypothetical protein LOY38_17790 [Pseudomonas sp. B21-015]
MSTSASKARRRYIRWFWIPLLPLLAFVLWRSALPTATVHYSKDGREELRYVWSVKDQIYRGRFSSGGSVSDKGLVSPDDEFFMEFSWHSKEGRWHCISIKPKWPNTNIFLDADGNIDMRKESGTDVEQLKVCQWDLAKP